MERAGLAATRIQRLSDTCLDSILRPKQKLLLHTIAHLDSLAKCPAWLLVQSCLVTHIAAPMTPTSWPITSVIAMYSDTMTCHSLSHSCLLFRSLVSHYSHTFTTTTIDHTYSLFVRLLCFSSTCYYHVEIADWLLPRSAALIVWLDCQRSRCLA